MTRTLPTLAAALALTLTSACATAQKPLSGAELSKVAEANAGILSMEVTTELKTQMGYPEVTIDVKNVHTGEQQTLELARGSARPGLKSFALRPGHYRFVKANIQTYPSQQGQMHIDGVSLTLVRDLLALPEFDVSKGEETKLAKALVFRLNEQPLGQGQFRATGQLTVLDPLPVLQQASTKE